MIKPIVRRPWILFIVLGALAQNACVRREDTGDEAQTLPLAGLQWPNKEAHVCFFPGSSPSLRAIVKWTIENTFNSSSNLKFMGFGECADQSRKDVRVAFATDPLTESRADLGIQAQDRAAERATLTIGKMATDSLFSERKATFFNDVIHEFGHAAGLLHEHQRPDGRDICPDSWSQTRTDDLQILEREARLLSGPNAHVDLSQPADLLSVMSYCQLDFLASQNVISNLSWGDVIGLSRLYGGHPSAIIAKRFFTVMKLPIDDAKRLKATRRLKVPDYLFKDLRR